MTTKMIKMELMLPASTTAEKLIGITNMVHSLEGKIVHCSLADSPPDTSARSANSLQRTTTKKGPRRSWGGRGPEKAKIIALMAKQKGPKVFTTGDFSGISKDKHFIGNLLGSMKTKGIINSAGVGRYRLSKKGREAA